MSLAKTYNISSFWKVGGLINAVHLNSKTAVVIGHDHVTENVPRITVNIEGQTRHIKPSNLTERLVPEDLPAKDLNDLLYSLRDDNIFAETEMERLGYFREIHAVVKLLEDDLQPRDWLHRGHFDPPESFKKLWEMPHVANTQAFKASPKCQCNQSNCCDTDCAGLYVSDPVICWQCNKFFHLNCLGGPQALMNGQAFLTGGNKNLSTDAGKSSGNLCEWRKCPHCTASLGAMSMPHAFRGMLGQEMRPVKSIGVELDYAMNLATKAKKAGNKEQAIKGYTRVINCVNFIRSQDPQGFSMGFKDNFIRANLYRAKLEGNQTMYKRLKEAFGRSGVKNSRRDKTVIPSKVDMNGKIRQWSTFATINDFHSIFINGADPRGDDDPAGQNLFSSLFGVHNCHQRTGYGAQPKYTTELMGTGRYNWKNQNGAPINFRQLDPERRGCNLWSTSPGKPDENSVTAMDMRWVFHTADAAKDFFTNSTSKSNEMNTIRSFQTSFVKNIATRMKTLQTKDDCIVTNGHGLVMGSIQGLHTTCLFRVGCIVGKIYIRLAGPKAKQLLGGEKNREQSLNKRLQFFAVAISNVREALTGRVDRSGSKIVGTSTGNVVAKTTERKEKKKNPSCGFCGIENSCNATNFKRCARCKRVHYCSSACQRKDWNDGGHKNVCRLGDQKIHGV